MLLCCVLISSVFGADFDITAGEINSSFIPQKTAYAVCINQKIIIPLLIENHASVASSFQVNIKGNMKGEYVSPLKKEITIKGKKGIIFPLLFEPKKSGNYSLFIDVESKGDARSGDALKKLKISITAENCYDAVFIGAEKIYVPDFVNSSSIPLTIQEFWIKTTGQRVSFWNFLKGLVFRPW